MISNTGRRLVFADNTVIENADAGYADKLLDLFLPDAFSMQEAAAIAFDTSKTQRITYEFGEEYVTYDGFTNAISIIKNPDDEIVIILKRGDA